MCVVKVRSADIEQIKRKALLLSGEVVPDSPSNGTVKEKQKIPEKALARKAHMLILKEKLLRDKESNDGAFADNRDKEIIKQAQKKIDQTHDIAKLIKSYSERAMAFTIRDQQLIDKKVIANQENAYENHMNLAMEIERLRCLHEIETEEQNRIMKRQTDLRVIEDQIEYRRQQKILAEEAQEIENSQIRLAATNLKAEEEQLERQKMELLRQNRIEYTKANEVAIALKKHRKQSEKEEEQRLLAYQLERDKAMRRREREEAEASHQKKELQKKMLESQEKHIDTKAQLDQIRARRAVEETERKYRQKVLQEARRRKEELMMLNEGRKQLLEQKLMMQKLRKEEELEEIRNATVLANEMAKRERNEAEARERKNAKLLSGLQEQILERESSSSRQQVDKFEDGRRTKEDIAGEWAKLEAMRESSLAELRSKGVQEKYLSEILSINIGKLLMR